MNPKYKQKLKKYKQKIRTFKTLKILSLLSSIIFLIILIILFFAHFLINAVATSSTFEIKEPISFLLLGSDYREEEVSYTEGARADAIIVVTLNPKNSRGNIEVNAVSIPRDNIASIPCGPQSGLYGKINSTLNEGLAQNNEIQDGIDCTIKSVEDLLNIKIDYYMMATFDAVIKLIDSIGGIEINSPYAFCEQDSKGNGYAETANSCPLGSIQIQKGKQQMDGETALAYARQRHGSSDYERNLRQQQVISKIVQKILKSPTKYGDNFLNTILNDFYTNIKSKDLINYFNFATTLFNNISNNLAYDIPVYLDYKSSPFENTQSNMSNGAFESNKGNNMSYKLLSDYYQNTKNFEKYTSVKRTYITKEDLNVPTEYNKNDKLEPIGIEVSTYSILSSEISDSYDTYIDYNTVYYTSNLLRASVNKDIAEPSFNYNVLNNYPLKDPLYSTNGPLEEPISF